MNPILKNILAVILGWLSGSLINMGLIQLGHKLIPIEGLDPNDMNAYAEIMPTLSFEYFIFPFLAHALGTLVGATVAGLIAVKHKMKFALAIGFLFLLGGLAISYMLPGPVWFTITDLIIAYIPMAWLGGKIALKQSKTQPANS
ncbi:hypothetical protein A9Q86_03405 [Flavobacteriales bacterium 33_180_T64]|nr:hypothetical protein A9Q86_03405 [Flavobacteriales bacterium 33_180_T64]